VTQYRILGRLAACGAGEELNPPGKIQCPRLVLAICEINMCVVNHHAAPAYAACR